MSNYRGRGGGFSRDNGGFQGRGGGGGGGRGRGGPSYGRGSGGENFSRGRGGGPQVSRDKVIDVTVQTNCFAITRIPDKEYYLYDTFEPEVKNFGRRQELFDKLQIIVAPQIFNPRALYDGKALVYVSHLLKLPSPSVFLIGWSDKPLVDKSRGVTISLKLTTSVPIRLKNIQNLIQQQGDVINNPEATTAINLLNIILRQDSNQKYAHNRKAFYSNVGKMSLGGGLELWRGFFQSVRPTEGNLLVNIDTTIAVMIQAGPLLDLCMDFFDFRNIKELELAERSQQYIRLEKFLKKMSVTLHGTTKKTRTIHGLVPKAGKYTFSKDGVDWTIEQYLNATYNFPLAHPNIVGVRLTSANAERQIILPLEACRLKEGQFYKQRLPDHFTANAVRFATLRPSERLGAIAGTTDSADSPILHYHTSEYIVASGMKIDTNPLSVRGRLLPLPKVKFQNGNLIPVNGGWNVVNRTLFKAAALKYWAVVNFAERVPPGQLQIIANYVKNCSRTLGLEVEEKFIIESGSGQAVEQVLNRTMATLKKHFPNFETDRTQPLLVVILPQEGAEVRRRVKYWSDIITGVLTQCIREGALKRANDQYYNNIALKLNARLRGSNFVVDSPAMSDLISRGPFIIMGADVAHPGPGVVKPSTTSLVWSYDCHATQYKALVEIQHPKQEIISDLQVMVYKAINEFGTTTGYTPKHIIFFRDGVSEGEFRAVVDEELKAIDAAVDVLWLERKLKDPKPKLTFIVVGKRHHIAFFPPKDSLANDGKGNCSAGFVSNQEDLSHPSTTDFYLQSHGAIQGTSRSGHYTVIKDEIYDLDVAKIQELSFSLCHLYAKATRSVSIPAPVYYADLACARSDFHFSPTSSLNFGSDAASVSSGGKEFNLEQWKDAFRMANKAAGMYFL